jgi:hypothetical protein
MKKGILATLILFVTVAIGQTQDQPRGDRFEKRAAEMNTFLEEIEVSDAQMKEIEAARKNMGEALKELRGQGRSEEAREKMESIRTDYAEQMKSILTEEQFAKWEEKVGDRRTHKRKRAGRPE